MPRNIKRNTMRNRISPAIAAALVAFSGGCTGLRQFVMMPDLVPPGNITDNPGSAPGGGGRNPFELLAIGSVISMPILLNSGSREGVAVAAGVAMLSIAASIDSARAEEKRAAERNKERIIREARQADPELRPEEVVLAYPLPDQTDEARRYVLIEPDTGRVLDRVIVLSGEDRDTITEGASAELPPDSPIPVAEGRRVVFVGSE